MYIYIYIYIHLYICTTSTTSTATFQCLRTGHAHGHGHGHGHGYISIYIHIECEILGCIYIYIYVHSALPRLGLRCHLHTSPCRYNYIIYLYMCRESLSGWGGYLANYGIFVCWPYNMLQNDNTTLNNSTTGNSNNYISASTHISGRSNRNTDKSTTHRNYDNDDYNKNTASPGASVEKVCIRGVINTTHICIYLQTTKNALVEEKMVHHLPIWTFLSI
jgi:hypothetical protein